jgi:hypothetical protein
VIERDTLHRLVDEIPETEVHTAEKFLSYLRHSHTEALLKILAQAPEDDEPETPQDAASASVGRSELDRGEGIPWEQVRSRFLKRRLPNHTSKA